MTYSFVGIILEGPDGAGKSTLASALHDRLRIPIQVGDGPPKNPGEIEMRSERYLGMGDVIFDRHPLVSQFIYARIRGESVSPELVTLERRLYENPPLVVYCRATDSSRQTVKGYDDPEHVEKLTTRYAELVSWYDSWAAKRADLIYRIGDNVTSFVDMVARIRSRLDAVTISADVVKAHALSIVNAQGNAKLKSLGMPMNSLVDAIVSGVNDALSRLVAR